MPARIGSQFFDPISSTSEPTVKWIGINSGIFAQCKAIKRKFMVERSIFAKNHAVADRLLDGVGLALIMFITFLIEQT